MLFSDFNVSYSPYQAHLIDEAGVRGR